MNKPALKNLKDKPYGGAQYVDDPNLKLWVKNTAIMIAEEEPWFDEDIHIKFLNRYREWLLSSKENYFVNLEWFEHSAFSLGTSEAFDKFYMKHSNRRFRCLPGEYMYHQASFRNFFPTFKSPLNVNKSSLSFLLYDFPSIHQGTNSGYFSISRTISISCSFLQGIIFFIVAEDIQVFYFLLLATF